LFSQGELQAQYQYPYGNGINGINGTNGISGLADQLNQARL
jgi:hypothetical protein